MGFASLHICDNFDIEGRPPFTNCSRYLPGSLTVLPGKRLSLKHSLGPHAVNYVVRQRSDLWLKSLSYFPLRSRRCCVAHLTILMARGHQCRLVVLTKKKWAFLFGSIVACLLEKVQAGFKEEIAWTVTCV